MLFATSFGVGVEFLEKCLLGGFFMLFRTELELDVLGRVGFTATETDFLTAVELAGVSGKWVRRKFFDVGWIG
jgi:hypothetical protein